MLKVEDLFYENDAMAGLECQSALPKEILKIIAEMLEDENEPVRERVARLLKGRSILPFSELQYRIGHAKRDGFLLRWLVEAPLEGELALPRGISNRHMECLYSAWLSESFKGNMYWYVDGDVSYIERSGKRIEMRLDCRGTQFLDMIRKIQTNLRVPLDNPPNPANL
ncbi:hypothetical protein F5Y10DRAFT_238554 [Nemania abortiva]|nr:hypothetical protein F5Y10DRAFT_238554 [Nemania abortiva]